MAIIEGIKKLMSFTAQKSFGFSGGFGLIRLGVARYGFYSEYAGVWQRKKTLKGYRTSRMKFYRPTNPQTIKQQNWRVFAGYMWTVWASLSTAGKNFYAEKAKVKGISATNLFMSNWLKYPPTGYGSILIGVSRYGDPAVIKKLALFGRGAYGFASFGLDF